MRAKVTIRGTLFIMRHVEIALFLSPQTIHQGHSVGSSTETSTTTSDTRAQDIRRHAVEIHKYTDPGHLVARAQRILLSPPRRPIGVLKSIDASADTVTPPAPLCAPNLRAYKVHGAFTEAPEGTTEAHQDTRLFPYEMATPAYSEDGPVNDYDHWCHFGSGIVRPGWPEPSLSKSTDSKLLVTIITDVAESTKFYIRGLYESGLLPLETLNRMNELRLLLYEQATKLDPDRPFTGGYVILKLDYGPVIVRAMREVHQLLKQIICEQVAAKEAQKQVELLNELDRLADVLLAEEDAANARGGIVPDKGEVQDTGVYDALTVLMRSKTDRPATRNTKMAVGLARHVEDPRQVTRVIQYPKELNPGRGRPSLDVRAEENIRSAKEYHRKVGALTRSGSELKLAAKQDFTKKKDPTLDGIKEDKAGLESQSQSDRGRKPFGGTYARAPIGFPDMPAPKGTLDDLASQLGPNLVRSENNSPDPSVRASSSDPYEQLRVEFAFLQAENTRLRNLLTEQEPDAQSAQQRKGTEKKSTAAGATKSFPKHDPKAAGDNVAGPASKRERSKQGRGA